MLKIRFEKFFTVFENNFCFSMQQTEPADPDPNPPESPKQKFHSFCKILTASDTSTHGGFSVLRKHATECLPPLVVSYLTEFLLDCAVNFFGFLSFECF